MVRTFRSDIEGLRALAVVPILVFHLKSSLCPGGFAGVDVFFVISGYLITRMILGDEGNGRTGTFSAGTFSFKTFYLRRFFRLFPALLTTLLGTLVAGWWVLGPSEYVSLARSALPSLFGVSNFYFLSAIDYFHASAIGHPLLHTWSLGVEEQFYLVWPAFILLLSRRGWALLMPAAALAVVSFVAILAVRQTNADVAFYMMPFRMFEFAAGAIILAVERRWNALPAAANTLAGAAGVALLAVTFSSFDEQTGWPGAAALVPVAATALMILGGARGVWSAVLRLWPLRFLGRISYSLYLVHWPVITLYRAWAVTEPGALELAGLGCASVVLGFALYRCVEVPFRQTKRSDIPGDKGSDDPPWMLSTRIKAQSLAASGALFAGLLGAITITGGFPSRLDRTKVQFLDKGLTYAGEAFGASLVAAIYTQRCVVPGAALVGESGGCSHPLTAAGMMRMSPA